MVSLSSTMSMSFSLNSVAPPLTGLRPQPQLPPLSTARFAGTPFAAKSHLLRLCFASSGDATRPDSSGLDGSSLEKEGSNGRDDNSKATSSNEMLARLKSYGISGILSYGRLNTAYSCSSGISFTSLNFMKPRSPEFLIKSYLAPNLHPNRTISAHILENGRLQRKPAFPQCGKTFAAALASETESDYETEEVYSSTEEYSDEEEGMPSNGQTPPPVKRRRRRYRKQYPGETNGITEEMRFVAMKLRNNGKSKSARASVVVCESDGEEQSEKGKINNDGSAETWQPSIEGILKYFVDSKLVFSTVERIVDESTDVSYVYFRRTGLERSDNISRDIEWLREQGNEIPEPSNQGVTYVQYLEELAEKSPPLFLCHFYNIYFSHITGGQVITRKVSDMLFEGRELDINKWDGDAEKLLKGVREKLNALGEHWSRDEKNRCLRETTKAFRFLGQIVRLIIL